MMRIEVGSATCATALFGRMDNRASIAVQNLRNETVAIYRAVRRNPPFAPLRKLYK